MQSERLRNTCILVFITAWFRRVNLWNQCVCQQLSRYRKYNSRTQWNITCSWRKRNPCHLQESGWNRSHQISEINQIEKMASPFISPVKTKKIITPTKTKQNWVENRGTGKKLRRFYSLVSVTVLNTMIMNDLGGKIYHWEGSQGKKSRQESGVQDWIRDHEGMQLLTLSFMTCSVTFLI